MAVSRPWPEKLCGMPNIPYRQMSRAATMTASLERRFLFITKTGSNYQAVSRLLGFGFFLRGRDLGHGGLGHFQPQVVRRHSQVHGVILQSHDRSLQAPGGYDLIAGLEGIQHGRPFLLAALLGKNQQEIKDRKNKNERGDAQPPHSATASLHRQKGLHVLKVCSPKPALPNYRTNVHQALGRNPRTTAHACKRRGLVISPRECRSIPAGPSTAH